MPTDVMKAPHSNYHPNEMIRDKMRERMTQYTNALLEVQSVSDFIRDPG